MKKKKLCINRIYKATKYIKISLEVLKYNSNKFSHLNQFSISFKVVFIIDFMKLQQL